MFFCFFVFYLFNCLIYYLFINIINIISRVCKTSWKNEYIKRMKEIKYFIFMYLVINLNFILLKCLILI